MAIIGKGLKLAFITLFLCFFGQQLLAQPAINSFSPLMGPVGTTLSINGANFNPVAANNVVFFGAVRATVTAATINTLTVIVPGGASYAPITVTTSGLTAYSSRPFTVTFPGGGAITSSSFDNKIDLGTEDSPYDIASGDLDGDGKPDIVVVNGGYPYSISVYRNTSSGGSLSFAPKIDYPTGIGPFSIAIGDIDGDGKPDVVVANEYSFTISVFRNTGTAGSISFDPGKDIPALNPSDIVIADLDKDGRSDLIVTNDVANSISLFKNTGAPGTLSFAPRIDYSTGSFPANASVGDIDGDQWPDIVVANEQSDHLSIFKNNGVAGSLSFNSITGPYTGTGSSKAILSDLDGDSKPDLGVTNHNVGEIAIFRNISSVGNIAFGTNANFKTTANPIGLGIADVDGDGKPDLAITSGEDSISVLRNASSTGVIVFEEKADVATGQAPYQVAIADLDGDHMPDLATVNQTDNTVSLIRNKVNGPNITSFTPVKAASGNAVTIQGTNFTGVTSVMFGGVSAQSFTIISSTTIQAVVGTGATGEVRVTAPSGTGTRKGFTYLYPPVITSFSPAIGSIGSEITITGSGFTDATAIKFGGVAAQSFMVLSDNTIKAVVGSGSSGNISVTTAVATATSPGFTYSALSLAPVITSFSPASGPVGTTVTITGNNLGNSPADNIVYFGATQATVLSASSTLLTVQVPAGASYQPITVTTNRLTASSAIPFTVTFAGGPAFTMGTFDLPVETRSNSLPWGACAADMDGDGKPDIMHGDWYGPYLRVLRNTSIKNDLSFASEKVIHIGEFPIGIATGDIDGDGKTDLAIAKTDNGSWGGGKVAVLKNTSTAGNVSFAPQIDYPVGPGTQSIVLADLDLDGRPEMIVGVSSADLISVFKNTSVGGNIAFAQNIDYASGDGPVDVSVADLDGDGKPEIISTNINAGTISVYQNRSTNGTISFASKVDYATGVNPASTTLGDFDGDGKWDIAVATSNNSVVVFRNTSAGNTVSLASKITVSTPSFPETIKCSDLNGDGKPELAAFCGRNPQCIAVFKNTGSPGSVSFAAGVNYPVALGTQDLVIADLDGDGKDDLAGGGTGAWISIWRNKIGAARTVPSGANPVTGVIVDKTTIDATVNTFNGYPYVQRHYDIEPALNAATATATVTLYFTQQEFDNFNASAGHGLNLPTDPNDISNKANLRIYQYHGNSTVYTPGSYSGAGMEINPDDTNIVWNSNAACWEVTCNVTGFSGFFVSSAGFNQVVTPTITVVGQSSFCGTGTALLTSSAPSNNQWYKDGVAINGATAQSLQTTTSGNYTATATANGITSASSNGIVITFTAIPAKPTINTDGVSLFSSSLSENQWYKEGVAISGAVSQAYVPAEPAYYTVRLITNGCAGPLSADFYFVPPPVISANGNTNFCPGETVILTSSVLKDNQWYKNGVEIKGATANNYQVTDAGLYKATATSNNVSSGPSNTIIVTLKPAPAKPVIKVNGALLESNAAAGNQWYQEGAIIPGATMKTYKPVKSANYSVVVTNNGCASVESDRQYFAITGIINIDNTHYIKLSPNPVSSQVVLNFNLAGTTTVNIQIVDLNGRVCGTYGNLSDGHALDLGGLANGVYLAKVLEPKGKTYTLKLLKQ
ncbi:MULTISPECIES: FG-GAP-like repeat-containing protein [Niastella]|uniref:VCBS repeat-containing protein n=1 Tax=Niastella soli TaxID=2821487 RepID=A0ABS3Z5R2_9BACT|nr:FG-GAP-like repeat-containing protein [Niastella soli]MBO9205474.1 VCBS repeat-containing protein [Niastella soli]